MEVNPDGDGLLTEEEGQRLMMSLVRFREAVGTSEEQVYALLSWANQAKVGWSLVEAVIAGKLNANVTDAGEVTFYHPDTHSRLPAQR